MSQYSPHNAFPLFSALQPPPNPSQYATERPPRSTRAQDTRWDTQDEAYAARASGIGVTIMEALSRSPSTCDELEIALRLTHQTCSAAVNKLMRDGLIVAGVNRKTRSNRNARVWSVREAAK